MTADNPFQVFSPAFRAILGREPRLVTVAATDAHEGPVYVPRDNALYFTSVPTPEPKVSIKKVALEDNTVSIVREDANMANGMTLDRDGSLLICEQGTTTDAARISRMDLPTGQIETVVDGWFGLPFNSPNDVVVRRTDGTIWFTDPSYGYLQDFRPAPQSGNYIYRFDPATRWLEVVADGFSMPNGLAFSPDDSILYVTDSGAIQEPGSYTVSLPHHVIALDVVNGRRLANARLFATITPGVPDGIKLDTAGNVYTGCGDGVQVFDPDGIMIGKILIDGGVPNLTFGGPGNDTLYICADTYIYAVKLLRA